jgi:hypothetical protein
VYQVADDEWAERLCRPYLPYSVAEIERDLASVNRSTAFRVTLHPTNAEQVRRFIGQVDPFLEYTPGALVGILGTTFGILAGDRGRGPRAVRGARPRSCLSRRPRAVDVPASDRRRSSDLVVSGTAREHRTAPKV